MDRLLPWLLLVAAVEIAGGLAGGSIGLAAPAIEPETTSRTQESDSPAPSKDAGLSVFAGRLSSMRGDTETALSWDDDISLPCTTCTTAAEDAAPVQVEAEGPPEALPSTPVEPLVKETPPVVSPVRGLKSLILGSLVLSVLLLIMNAPDEVQNEDNALATWRHYFAEEMIDGMFALDDFLDTKVPAFPFKILSFWVLAGAAPMLFFSGLVNIARSLKKQRHGQPLRQGPRVSGFPLIIMTALLSIWMMMLPVYRDIDDDDDPLLEDVSVNLSWGINLAYLSLLLL
ncbi:uncharacterized protein EMH_0047460 [Eimeria mitis]|uniref:Uncharacterized protein n=1 Tax=Eimeria mitis TaxID=44415 RepID=U6K377_9EIME|nr:uncharacterized protein EMH_0047460 [Eimeria mitis]CDJ30782.1 hypothetical protein, conserved [Eimeria mitis]